MSTETRSQLMRNDDLNGLLGEIRTKAEAGQSSRHDHPVSEAWRYPNCADCADDLALDAEANCPGPEAFLEIGSTLDAAHRSARSAREQARTNAAAWRERAASIRRPSLLPDRPMTPEERAAREDSPRSGLWAGEPRADLSALTQEETDSMIRKELWMVASDDEKASVDNAIGALSGIAVFNDQGTAITTQRGGIDSDPLVRLLAYRAWGDRDRQWFELRGVRKGDELEHVAVLPGSNGQTAVAKSWRRTSWSAGMALGDARPGETVSVQWTINSREKPTVVTSFVSDRLRDDPDVVEIVATLGMQPGDRVEVDGIPHRVERVEHTEAGGMAWCRRERWTPAQDTRARRSPYDQPGARTMFDFDECEMWRNHATRSRTLRATREGREVVREISDLVIREANFDVLDHEMRQASERLGPRRAFRVDSNGDLVTRQRAHGHGLFLDDHLDVRDRLSRPGTTPHSPEVYRELVANEVGRLRDAGMRVDRVVQRILDSSMYSDVEVSALVREVEGRRNVASVSISGHGAASPRDIDHHPGARRSGAKPKPPVPPWAKQRRQRAPLPGR